MSVSDDEYDRQLGGAIKLSDEDCAAIDALTAGHTPINVADDIRHISLATSDHKKDIAPSHLLPNGASSWDTKLSPYERFRSYGRLSVTDLVAPSWCEVQFEYGLQQQRSRRLDKRPQTIVTRQGKEITVERKTAELNDVILRGGHAVHSALERETRPVTVEVRTTSKEETWGLRLFNMLNDIETLLLLGKCREFPVVGFIKDQLVVGVIDEIHWLPLEAGLPDSSLNKRPGDASLFSTPTKPKPKRSKSGSESPASDNQPTLHAFFSVASSKTSHVEENSGKFNSSDMHISQPLISPNIPSGKPHTLHLVDHKTRNSPTLPQESATLSSRLQLMLYRRLLNGLVSLKSPFDFDKLWKQLQVDPNQKFSTPFLSQLYPDEPPQAACIRDLQDQWSNILARLELEEKDGEAPVHQQLTILYRRRASGKHDRRRRRGRKSSPEPSSEEKDLQAAILASLQQPNVPAQSISLEKAGTRDSSSISPNASDISDASKVQNHDADAVGSVISCAQTQNGFQVCHPNAKQSNFPSEGMSSGHNSESGGIIGKLQFRQDDALLNDHLTKVLQWWYGERDPIGVSLEDADRCITCEYANGCEWREGKAQEAKQNLVNR